ncbi:acyl carrier protein [Streptomyces monticola]|uniref:Acyl carrier protein n=1 Tax=Streptomyces monticola TaxID=2666263 RepID=A0ABW2JXW6_9ACTN
MTSEPHLASPAAAPLSCGADVLTELTTVLAGILRLKPETIDPEQPFQLLGLDSMTTVEFVASVNAAYGTHVKVTALYDYPTPSAFARHVAADLGILGPPPAPEPAPPPAASAPVIDVLREQLAEILCCDPWDIDADAAFNLLGLDSILGAEFVAVINRTYGLNERAVSLYDHPSLGAIASHIAARTGLPAGAVAPAATAKAQNAAMGSPARSATGSAAASAPGAAAMSAGPRRDLPALGAMDLEALLDAVRDDRLSVDEAAALLAARAA